MLLIKPYLSEILPTETIVWVYLSNIFTNRIISNVGRFKEEFYVPWAKHCHDNVRMCISILHYREVFSKSYNLLVRHDHIHLEIPTNITDCGFETIRWHWQKAE